MEAPEDATDEQIINLVKKKFVRRHGGCKTVMINAGTYKVLR